MIRPAVLADVPRLVEMGHAFINSSQYDGRLADNPAQMAAMAAHLIESDQGLLLVADRGGALVGMIGVLRFDHHLSAEPIAGEVFWWVEPAFRGCGVRLMKRAEQWAKAAGAVRMQMVSPAPQVGQMYERLGYHPIEVAYERTL